MEYQNIHSCIAFLGNRRIAAGSLAEVAGKVKETVDQDMLSSVLIFDDLSSGLVEVDFRGTNEEVLKKLQTPEAGAAAAPESVESGQGGMRKPGRPKLGVVSREVTLLPRHWDWLNSQPGGASVALRKLVDEARRTYRGRDRLRQSQESAYRFMSAMAGNLPDFEEAARALFAGKPELFSELVASWPADIRDHVQKLSDRVFLNLESRTDD